MPKFTFGPPHPYLKGKELIALREGKFEIHCLDMKLERSSGEGQSLSGAGFIRQMPDGQLHFTLYDQESAPGVEIISEVLGGGGVPPGKLLPEYVYYRLSAIDLEGREWVSNKVLPDKNSSDQGTVCTGRLGEITYKSEFENFENLGNSFLFLEILGDINLPFNARTEINKTVAGKESISFSLNVLHFEANGYEFLLQKEANSLLISVDSAGTYLPEYFETKIIEAFQFVLARLIVSSIMIKRTGENIVTSIYETRLERSKTNPPISLNDNTDAFCKLFEGYLNYVLSHSGKGIHPISSQMRAICRANVGTVETQALIISVAVESILKYVHPRKHQLSSEEKEWIKEVKNYLSSWEDPKKNLGERIKKLLDVLPNPSASASLSELVTLQVITYQQQQAWKKLRNSVAHGEMARFTSLQKLLDLISTVLVLFYHLVFYAIGYQGKYTDYSVTGWPIKDYTVPGDATANPLKQHYSRKEFIMTKWEYCRVVWMVRAVSTEEVEELKARKFDLVFRPVEGNNQSLAMGGYLEFLSSPKEVEKVTNLNSTIAQLGLEGWELVSHASVSVPLAEVFYFKRQVEE